MRDSLRDYSLFYLTLVGGREETFPFFHQAENSNKFLFLFLQASGEWTGSGRWLRMVDDSMSSKPWGEISGPICWWPSLDYEVI